MQILRSGLTAALAFLALPLSSNSAFADRVVGVGVQIRINAALQTEVIGVLPASPAAAAAILPGDLILAVDGRFTGGQPLEVVTSWLRGPGFVGSPVLLTVHTPSTRYERTLRLQREVIGEDCVFEGNYSLHLSGSPDSGWISGYIGQQSVDWSVAFGRVNARAGLRFSTLDIVALPYTGDLEVSGWLGSSWIRWRSFGGFFSGYQPCVRE